MADSLPAHIPVWPTPTLCVIERRLYELLASPPRIEQLIYGPLNALLNTIFTATPPDCHFVYPQGPLRAPLDEQGALPPNLNFPTDFDLSTEVEPDWDLTSSSLGSIDILSDRADPGDNSGPNGTFDFPTPPSGDISITNDHMPVAGRGRGRILPGDIKFPDFIVSQVNPNGCLAIGGGPDIIRLVIEVKAHLHPTPADIIQISEYALRLLAMNAVGAGLLLILQGNAYFWSYEELDDNDSFSRSRIMQRQSRRIDSEQFLKFLLRWKERLPDVTF